MIDYYYGYCVPDARSCYLDLCPNPSRVRRDASSQAKLSSTSSHYTLKGDAVVDRILKTKQTAQISIQVWGSHQAPLTLGPTDSSFFGLQIRLLSTTIPQGSGALEKTVPPDPESNKDCCLLLDIHTVCDADCKWRALLCFETPAGSSHRPNT